MSWNMLQGRYNDCLGYRYEQWDYLPDTAHYRYLDTSDSRYYSINGFTNFDIKRRLPGRKGHNITLGGTWNYLFSARHNESQRLISLAEGNPAALLLQPYDRTNDNHYNRNTVDLSLRYNRPLGPRDEFSIRLGGRPYGNSHRDRDLFDSNLYLETVNAPTVATTEERHSAYRFVTFGVIWRIGKLDLEWQARGGAAGQ